jgi:FAD:protein FMN transferase
MNLRYLIRLMATAFALVVHSLAGGLGGTALRASDQPKLERFEFTEPQMGVPFKIVLYAPDEAAANRASRAAFDRIAALNSAMSDYDPKSELSQLSASSPVRQKVSDDRWKVLSRSQELAESTDGAFDITVGPFVRLWRRSRRIAELPLRKRLDEARAASGYKLLKLHPGDQSVELLAPGMRLDLGGIAMGYAVDEGLKVLAAHGIESAMIDASGDIGVSGPPLGRTAWRIGVAPNEPEGPPSRYVDLVNAAITTSGDAFQFVEIGGVRYSHIIDPKTGLGLTTQTSVTVIAPDCIAADSLATAVSVLGLEKGFELIDKTSGAAAISVQGVRDEVPQVKTSARFDEFLSKIE